MAIPTRTDDDGEHPNGMDLLGEDDRDEEGALDADLARDEGEPPEEDEQPLAELDRDLLAEAEHYEIPYQQWKSWTPKERGMAKGRRHSGWKRTARRVGLDEEEFCRMSKEEREKAVVEATERRFRQHRGNGRAAEPPPEPPKVFTPFDDDVPPPDGDPRQREGHTIGLIEPAAEPDAPIDRGDWQVRNLVDACSYYHVGDGHHRIRVERKEPKVWQGVRANGFVGWITQRMSEEEFAEVFGGSVYELIVYGPEPRGKHDPNTGMRIEKALTKPFSLTIAGCDPVVTYPGEQEAMNSSGPWQGHGGGFPPRRPLTTAEASMHKTEADLTRELMRDLRAENRELRGGGGGGRVNDTVMQEITRQARELTEQALRAASDKEKALTEQLAERAKEISELRKALQETTVNTGTLQSQIATLSVEKKVMEEALAAARNRHQEELGRLSSLRSEEIQHTKERHAEELKREQQRADEFDRKRKSELDDAERKRKAELDEAVARADQKLKDAKEEHEKKVAALKEEMESVRKRAAEEIVEVRKRASEEVESVRKAEEKRLEQRVSDLKEHHERELRQAREHHEHILGVAKIQHEGVLANVSERMERLKSELEEAEEKAEEAGDPALAIEKFKEQAGKMGFEEKEGPKTAWERFATIAGAGVGKALEDLPKWLPEVTRNLRGEAAAAGARQLPPGGRPAVAAPRQRVPGVAYVRNQQQGHGTPVPPPHQPAVAPAASPVAPAPAEPPAPPAAAMPQVAPDAPEPEAPAPVDGAAVLAHLRANFGGDEPIGAFRAEAEKWIENDGEPSDFAAGFATQFPEQAKGLAAGLRARDLIAAVKAMPGSEDSQLLRPNGRKWVEAMMKALRKATA